MPVNTPCREYVVALPVWERCRDTSEGSDAVKAKGQKYLPPLGSHKKKAEKYEEYLLRALFFNAMSRTIGGLAGLVHQKAPVVTVPGADVKKQMEDVTLSGTSAELFALKTTSEILTVGRAGILVDMSRTEGPDQRPYWIMYAAEQVISWRTERLDGNEVLTRVILREFEDYEDPADKFVTKQYEQYRVLELRPEGYCQTLYRRQKEGDNASPFVPVIPEGQTEPEIWPEKRGKRLPHIPFTLIGTMTTNASVSKPPLVDLADVNLSHYRGYADLKHGLHKAALPTPWVAGMKDENDTEPLEMGSGVAWQLDKDGKADMLEVAGPGFSSIAADLVTMQRMMAVLGARLLEEQSTVPETMGAVGMRHSGEHATLRTIANAVEQGITLVIHHHVWWTTAGDVKLSDIKAGMELNKDFFAVKASPEEVKAALLLWQSEAICFETLYQLLQRGSWTREGVDAKKEKSAIEEEAPDPAPPPADPNNPDDPNAVPPPAGGGPQPKPGQSDPPAPKPAGNGGNK